jgi:rhodanese-related sulfurtransferase
MKTAYDLVAAAKTCVQEISVVDVDAAILAGDVLVDVREADEFAAGHLAGAVHISRGMLEFKFSANPDLQSRDLPVLLYCKTSGRAALAAVALRDMGYLKVRSIAGGFDAWVASGRPVVKPEPPAFE